MARAAPAALRDQPVLRPRRDQDYDRFCHATDVAHYNRVLMRADLVGGAAV
jgi:hypothetical protein